MPELLEVEDIEVDTPFGRPSDAFIWACGDFKFGTSAGIEVRRTKYEG